MCVILYFASFSSPKCYNFYRMLTLLFMYSTDSNSTVLQSTVIVHCTSTTVCTSMTMMRLQMFFRCARLYTHFAVIGCHNGETKYLVKFRSLKCVNAEPSLRYKNAFTFVFYYYFKHLCIK